MIFAFHWFYLYVSHFVKQWRQNFKNEQTEVETFVENKANEHTYSFRDAELNIKFDPPVYKQRYEAVQRVIVDERWRSGIQKLVDFGCAEFGLFMFLKRLYNLHDILAVDVDANLLKDNLFRLRPLNVDYLKKRPQPLEIKVLQGSICEPDPVLVNTDMVVAIEMLVNTIIAYFRILLHVFLELNIYIPMCLKHCLIIYFHLLSLKLQFLLPRMQILTLLFQIIVVFGITIISSNGPGNNFKHGTVKL